MAFPLIAAAAATVGNALLQKSANKQNIENQWQLFSAQNQRQDWLNANSALIQRQALHKAGLNINSEYGGYPNLVGVTPTKSDVQSPQIDPNLAIGAAQLLQNKPLVQAQARETDAKAKAQEIENARNENYDSAIDKSLHDWLFENEPGDFVVNSKPISYNKGNFEARKDFREFQSRMKELKKNDVVNALDEMIADKQLHDSELIQKVADMKKRDYDKLCEEISNLGKDRQVMDSVIALNGSQKELNEANKDWVKFRKQVEENTNLANMISNLVDGDITAKDVVKFIFLSLLKSVGAFNVSVGL